MLLSELAAQQVEELEVDLSGAQVPVRVRAEHLHLGLNEGGEGDGELGVAEIDEGDDSGLLGVEVRLPEEAVGEGDGCALVDEPHAVDAGNLSRVQVGLPLDVGGVSRH
mmetsp:Transcript_3646/g.6209  ORF Transcript_3646/g.6209 Transcript_3646/m.6209 type:complete len:109 (+) Transcript_3646:1752-2078(+)